MKILCCIDIQIVLESFIRKVFFSLVFRYNCRLFSNKDGVKKIDPCAKPKKVEKKISCTGEDLSEHKRPSMETAQHPPETCYKGPSSAASTPSLMDEIPVPNINCRWEDEEKKLKFKKTLPLIIGLIFLGLTIIPVVSTVWHP